MKIIILGLGERSAKNEHEQITWFLDQYKSEMSKRAFTALLLDIHEEYFNSLIDNECYNFLHYLSSNLSSKQIKDRLKWRDHQKNEDRLLLEKWTKWHKAYKEKEYLLTNWSAN